MKQSLRLSLVLFALLTGVAMAQSTPLASERCVQTSFTGQVRRGETFAQPISTGLTYRLAPVQDSSEVSGWTIEVMHRRHAGEPEQEFSWPMNPPYRQWNQRDVNTTYGTAAEVAVGVPHEVFFVLNLDDYKKAESAVSKFLWNSTDEEYEAARKVLPTISTGSADLNIKASKLEGRAESQSIEWLQFQVELTVPRAVVLDASLKRNARPAQCPQPGLFALLRLSDSRSGPSTK